MKISSQFNKGNSLRKAGQLASRVCLILSSFALSIDADAQSTQEFTAGSDSLVVYSNIPGIPEFVDRIDETDLQDIRVVSDKYSIRVRSVATGYQWVDVFTHYTYNRGAEIALLPQIETGAPHVTNTQHYPNFTRGWSHTYGNIEISPDHPVEVEIGAKNGFQIKNQDFFKAAVHPSHKASAPTVVNGKVYFTISNPAQVTIDINGQMDDHNELINPIGHSTHAISLFASPVLIKPPLSDARTFYVSNGQMPTAIQRDTYDTLYFMPGVHDIGLDNKLYPGKTYYIPGDAIVFGAFNNLGVDKQTYPTIGSGIRFSGYGTITGVRTRHPRYIPNAGDHNYYKPIMIDKAEDYEIYGVTVVDPANHSVFIPSGKRGAVRWAKTIGFRANSDGFAGNDHVDDCFMRTSDDCSYVRGNRKRCVFWKDHFSAVFYMSYIPSGSLLIEDCDIIYLRSRQSDGRGGALFNCRGDAVNGTSQTSGALPTNVTFRNLRVHDKRSNMCIFNMFSYKGNDLTGNTTESVACSYSNIKFQNISIAGSSVMQYLLGCGPSPWNAGSLTFDNVSFDGVLLTQQNFNSYFVTNQHVGAQTFLSSAIPVTGVFVNGGTVDPLIAGQSTQLFATVLPENADNQVVSWTTSNPAVASVDSTGLVTALSAGTATITVTTQDGGKTAIRNLSVTGPQSTVMASFGTPGTYNWVVPANVSAVTVECRGGGGSGGSVNSQEGSSQNIRGGGGAGGNFAKRVNIPVSSGQTYLVTVGAGGAPSITGFVHNESLSSQTGGSSSFTTADLATTHALATGGVGGKNGLRIGAATGAASNAGATTAISSGSVGDAIFTGGNGSGAGFPYTGSGGGGAGSLENGNAADNSATGGGLGGDAGGGRGANGVDGLNASTGNGTDGTAHGGGGSGAGRNTAHSIFVNGPGGAGGAGSVLLTWTIDTGTTQYAVTSANSSEAVGAVFDVTITAQDNSNNTVTEDTNVITLGSPSSDSLMEFDWNADGTFGDNSGTLTAGVQVIKARNKKAQTADIVASAGLVTTPIPLSITTTAGAFSKLQLLAPGETAVPGTVTGKTGTPTDLPVGVAFGVTVNAVDEFWNLIDTVTDTVAITSTDGLATLPADTPLLAGTVVLPVTFNTPGPQALTASDVTDPLKTANTSPNISVTVVARTWGATIDNRWDTTTANWTGLTFADLNAVTFSSNSVNSFVDLNGGTVAPISILANATSAAYEFSNGSITGMAGGLTKAQAGTLILDTNNTYTGPTTVNGGLLRLKNANSLPTTSALILNTGILGLESGDFTRSLGAAAGQVVLTAANGGFAAFGADRIVNHGGAGAQVTWGSGGFFNAGSSLTLGHASATHTIDFQNPIDIAGTNREINVLNGGAEVDAIISGAITNSGANTHIQKNGNGTLMLTGVNAWGDELRILAGKVMLGGNTGMVIADSANVQLGAGGTGSGVIFDLNGRSETIATLNLGGQNTTTAPGASGNQHKVVNSAGMPAVLTVNGLTYFAAADPLAPQNGQATVSADLHTGAGNKNFNINNSNFDIGTGPLAEEVLVTGALTGDSITKLLTGTLVLTNPQYSGDTTISAGTLILRKPGNQTNANPNNDASTITIATGAVLDLDYTGTDTVASLVIGANPSITSGIYGSADFPGVITGSGKLMVGNDAFLAWAGNNSGVLFDGDENNDGVKNGLAWLLGAETPNTDANGLLPLVTRTGGSLKMTFDMLPASARAGARLFVEHGSDLGMNDPWSAGVLVPDSTGGTAPVTFIVTDSNLVDPGNKLDVEASISAPADANQLFGRLRAEK
jgi:autotransporter-associated beta strand protein